MKIGDGVKTWTALDAASFAGYRDYQDVETLLANTSLAYGPGAQRVAAGDVIRTRAEGFSYEVAAANAVDAHVTTAGGVKLCQAERQLCDQLRGPKHIGAAC